MKSPNPTLFPELESLVHFLDTNTINDTRKEILKPLVDFIQSKVNSNSIVRLNFICTHNSRRSHLSQIWAQTLAHYFNIQNVFCYSGGTESTALFPKVAETLTQSGFQIQKISEDKNPVYSVKYSENEHPIIAFSKKLDDDFNPSTNFAAIMTCSQADGGCPFISGAEVRIPITYNDPKAFDGTEQQTEKYLETSKLIATELFYVFNSITKNEK